MPAKRTRAKLGGARAAEREEGPKGATTAIHLPSDLLELLRIVAVKRARDGGRPSVSAVIVALLEENRDELEAEARGT